MAGTIIIEFYEEDFRTPLGMYESSENIPVPDVGDAVMFTEERGAFVVINRGFTYSEGLVQVGLGLRKGEQTEMSKRFYKY